MGTEISLAKMPLDQRMEALKTRRSGATGMACLSSAGGVMAADQFCKQPKGAKNNKLLLFGMAILGISTVMNLIKACRASLEISDLEKQKQNVKVL